jgi:hypothetical protein
MVQWLHWGAVVVTLYDTATWQISVYAREHGVPHFHIEHRESRCSISIATFEVIVGRAPRQVLREALAWARQNRPVLLATWQRLNP